MSAIIERIKRLKNQIHITKLYREVFNTPQGEEVLNHLVKESGLLDTKLTTDTNLLLVQQGQRRIVLSILRTVGRDPHQITKQIEESMNYENPEQHTTNG